MKKNRLFALVIILNTIVITGFSQKKISKDPLVIKGAALLNNEKIRNYAISVYLDGNKIDSIYTKSTKSIYFYVSYHNVYTFLFQKNDCKDKIVIVNTNIPEGQEGMKDDIFEFEVEMSQSLIKDSKEIEDFPVAVLKINEADQLLEASESYNKLTHREWDLAIINFWEQPLIKETNKNRR